MISLHCRIARISRRRSKARIIGSSRARSRPRFVSALPPSGLVRKSKAPNSSARTVISPPRTVRELSMMTPDADPGGSHRLQHFDAVHLRHLDIERYQVGLRAPRSATSPACRWRRCLPPPHPARPPTRRRRCAETQPYRRPPELAYSWHVLRPNSPSRFQTAALQWLRAPVNADEILAYSLPGLIAFSAASFWPAIAKCATADAASWN